MAITTLDGYIASAKQRVQIVKTVVRTSLAVTPFSMFDVAGQPGAGVLAGTSTSAGVVPTDATVGCPDISFTSGVGYLSRVEYSNTVAGRLGIYDMLFKAGAYAYTAGTTTLSLQPDYSSRCPDYPGSGTTWGGGLEIYAEVSTAFLTGNAWQLQVTYTNSLGQAGHTTVITPVLAAAALILGRVFQLPLQAGDVGVQKIESVIVANPVTAMTAGAFNILVLRPVYTSMRSKIAGDGDVHDILKTGMPVIYNNSALIMIPEADSTSTGVPEVYFEIASA